MAYSPLEMQILLNLLDNENKGMQKSYQCHPGIVEFDEAVGPPVGAQQIATSLIGFWAGVSALTVPSYVVQRVYQDPAIVAPTDDTADGETVAHLLCKLSTAGGKNDTLDIPGPLDAIFVSATPGSDGYGVVDLTDAALLTFLNEFEDGTDHFTISDGEQLDNTTPVIAGVRSFRSSRKG